MTRLRKLLLAATSVSDAALMHLTSLAQLDELNLHNTQVTDEGVKKLKQALPKLRVDH